MTAPLRLRRFVALTREAMRLTAELKSLNRAVQCSLTQQYAEHLRDTEMLPRFERLAQLHEEHKVWESGTAVEL